MKLRSEIKVGLFAVIVIAIAAVVTIRVGDQSIVAGGAYKLYATFTDAAGLYPKASISIAGVNVGVVKEIGLSQDGRALVTMGIQKKVVIPKDSLAFLKTKGFLGEAYIEIIPGEMKGEPLKNGDEVGKTQTGGDVTSMVNRFTDIAGDVKDITATIKSWTNEKEGGAIANTVHNLDEFTRVMRDISVRNEKNMDRILNNMADLTHEIKEMVAKSKGNVEDSAANIASITQKIDEGRGSLGKLVNDSETVEKLNNSLDNLSEALGGYQKMELGLGFHTEYLTSTKDYKNYMSLDFWPTPDEALLVDLLTDPSPDTQRTRRISDITVGGATTTVRTEDEVLQRDALHLSIQLAKKFYNFRLRGGIIESKGGLGLDYYQGPLGLQFSAFDFETKFGEEPHLKLLSSLNVTPNFYLLGGLDDPLSPIQDTDYFLGGGFRLVDEDIKSLIGLAKFR